MKGIDSLYLSSAWAQAAVLVVSCVGVPAIAPAQCRDATTTVYGHSSVSRLTGNIEKLYNDTVMSGNYYNWWHAYIASGWSLNYVTQEGPSQWHTNGTYAIDETYEGLAKIAERKGTESGWRAVGVPRERSGDQIGLGAACGAGSGAVAALCGHTSTVPAPPSFLPISLPGFATERASAVGSDPR
jgi:hypothetical protein